MKAPRNVPEKFSESASGNLHGSCRVAHSGPRDWGDGGIETNTMERGRDGFRGGDRTGKIVVEKVNNGPCVAATYSHSRRANGSPNWNSTQRDGLFDGFHAADRVSGGERSESASGMNGFNAARDATSRLFQNGVLAGNSATERYSGERNLDGFRDGTPTTSRADGRQIFCGGTVDRWGDDGYDEDAETAQAGSQGPRSTSCNRGTSNAFSSRRTGSGLHRDDKTEAVGASNGRYREVWAIAKDTAATARPRDVLGTDGVFF